MTDMSEDVPDQLDQLDQDLMQPNETLVNRGVDDFLDEGYSPPEKPSPLMRYGSDDNHTLDERLEMEEPEVWEREDDGENLNDGQVGDARAGRLMDTNEGIGEDTEKDLVADDVGIDGGAASAEEAAVHIIPDDQTY